jgi:hypothetical protein
VGLAASDEFAFDDADAAASEAANKEGIARTDQFRGCKTTSRW